jgi:hypothetical protein
MMRTGGSAVIPITVKGFLMFDACCLFFDYGVKYSLPKPCGFDRVCPASFARGGGAEQRIKVLYEGGRPARGCPDAALPLEGALSSGKKLL